METQNATTITDTERFTSDLTSIKLTKRSAETDTEVYKFLKKNLSSAMKGLKRSKQITTSNLSYARKKGAETTLNIEMQTLAEQEKITVNNPLQQNLQKELDKIREENARG